jgi:membrane protein implicated in regulation of membrane protease activity
MTPSKAWLICAAVCVLIEILPPPTHFFFLCVAIGAIGAAIAAFFTAIPWVPWVVFTVVTVVLFPMMIPLARFLFTPRPYPSNVDELIGEKALVVEEVTSHTPGTVKVRSETWRAVSEGETISKDTWVQVVRVDGTRLVVKK